MRHAGDFGRPRLVPDVASRFPAHLIGSDDLPLRVVDEICRAAEDFETGKARPSHWTGKSVALLFFQPSTRTRMGFESATAALGHQAVGAADMQASRSNQRSGETLEDCAAVVSGLCDAIVVRHHEIGAAERMASVATCPVINAGDGFGEHPTQALIDVYSMRRGLGTLEGKSIAFCGDPRGRTVRSLVKLLRGERPEEVVFCPPDHLPVPKDLVTTLSAAGVAVRQVGDLAEILSASDAVMMAPYDMSDIGEPAASGYVSPRSTPDTHRLTPELLARTASRTLVYHPLPRLDEIAPACDGLPNARYMQQVRLSRFVRMAILNRWMPA